MPEFVGLQTIENSEPQWHELSCCGCLLDGFLNCIIIICYHQTVCDKAFEEDIIAPQSSVKKNKRGRPRKKPIDDKKKQQEIKTETLDNEEDWKPKKGKDKFCLENHF